MEKTDNDEVYISDIGDTLKKKTSSFLGFCSLFLMKALKFWYVLLVLIIIGGAIGYFLDKKIPNEYQSTAVLRLNNKSSEYIYNNIESLSANFQDSIYVNYKFPPKDLKSIKVEPISNFNDILISYNERNEDILRYLLENASAEKILSSEFFRSEYYYHKLIITGTNPKLDNIVSSIILDLNKNDYYQEVNKQHLKNLQNGITNAEYMVEQIDTSIASFNDFNRSYSENKLSSSGVQVVNSTLEINELITSKISLLEMIDNLKLEVIKSKSPVVLVDSPKTIKTFRVNIMLLSFLGVLFIYSIFLLVKIQSSIGKHS